MQQAEKNLVFFQDRARSKCGVNSLPRRRKGAKDRKVMSHWILLTQFDLPSQVAEPAVSSARVHVPCSLST